MIVSKVNFAGQEGLNGKITRIPIMPLTSGEGVPTAPPGLVQYSLGSRMTPFVQYSVISSSGKSVKVSPW